MPTSRSATVTANADTDEAESDGQRATPPPRQDLALFVRALRRELVSHAKRVDSIEEMQAAAATHRTVGKKSGGRASGGITVVRMCDPGAREVELEWGNGDVARLRVGVDGVVGKVVVRSREGGGGGGRRRRGLERLILGEGGRVDGVLWRLRRDGI
jgi:hypothetical protein